MTVPVHGLRRSDVVAPRSGPVVLVILDGVGVGRGDEFDAVATANTPTLDRLAKLPTARTVRAHGTAVGLASESDMGNSEVGHTTMGAGRIFAQGANVIDSAIASGRIWDGDWRWIVDSVTTAGSTLHLIGLLSDGGVHSNLAHLLTLIAQSAKDGVARLRVHVLLDGRDVPDFTALDYVRTLEGALAAVVREHGYDYRIASGGGRMVTTMDRYGANWPVVEAGWAVHVRGQGPTFTGAEAAITALRAEHPGISDQELPAFVIADDAGPVGPIRDGDAAIVFNFRGDRAIEIAEALTTGPDFVGFARGPVPDIAFAAMCCYDTERDFPQRYLVRPEPIQATISEYLAASGLRQLACSETQKFGHVTYFWNGNRSERFDDASETYVEIASDPVSVRDFPQMKSVEIADTVIDAIASGEYDFIRCNFAGGDMVGHTADLAATQRALEAIDAALARINDATALARGTLVVTADHGNAEDMVERDSTGDPLTDDRGQYRMKTAHSINPVVLIINDYGDRPLSLRADLPEAGLANLAATLLELLGFAAPDDYEPSLLAHSGPG